MDFIKRNFDNIIKFFINQVGITIFTLFLYTAAGFMFVMLYDRSKSIVICIAAHGIFNAISAFSNEAGSTDEIQIITALLLTAITGSYALYLAFALKEKQPET
jgi:membrane protease YdiL (CAAX protease family)